MGKRARTTSGKTGSVLTARPETDRQARRRERIEKQLVVADRRVARRRAQLEAASARRAALADRLAALADADAVSGGPVTDSRSVQAYCVRERVRVTVRDPKPVTFANGRSALAGVCSSCGARVVSLKAV